MLAAFAATAAAHAIKDDPEFLVEAEEEAAEEVGSEKQEPLKDQATLRNTKTKASAKNAEPVKTKSLLVKASQAKVEVTKPDPVKATVVAAKAKAAPAKVAHTNAKPANAKLTKVEKAKVEPAKSHPVKVNATVVAAKAKTTPAEVAQTKAAEKTKTAEPMVAKAEAPAAEKEDSDADDDDIVRFTGKAAETGDWGEEYEGHMTAMERTNFYAKYYSREAVRGKHFRLQVPEPEQMPGVHSGAGRMAAVLAPVAILLSF